MRLGTIFGNNGTVEDNELAERRAQREQVRAKRVDLARREDKWTEIPAERLVSRGPSRFGWLVDAETDLVWVRAPGSFFVRDSVTLVATHVAVTYFVDAAGDIVALERAPNIATWSDVIRTRPDLATSAAS